MRRILEVDGEEIPVWLASTRQGHVLHMGEREIFSCKLLANV